MTGMITLDTGNWVMISNHSVSSTTFPRSSHFACFIVMVMCVQVTIYSYARKDKDKDKRRVPGVSAGKKRVLTAENEKVLVDVIRRRTVQIML